VNVRTRVQERPLFESLVPTPCEVAELHELQADLDRVLSTLLPREAAIVRGYFGLGTCEGSTLDEIGKQIGLCQERVRQIRDKALRKLRHPVRRTKLAAYVGIHGDEEYARFVEAESAAQRAAREAERAARDASWEEQRAKREEQRARREALWAVEFAKREAQRVRREERQRARLLQRIGDPIGDVDPEMSGYLRGSIADTLGRATARTQRRIRSESELLAYFAELSRHRDLCAALAAWKRDAPGDDGGPFMFTRAVLWDGSFMLYARRNRGTWYLCDVPGGLRWVGFATTPAGAL
jgi:hypothetical protein